MKTLPVGLSEPGCQGQTSKLWITDKSLQGNVLVRSKEARKILRFSQHCKDTSKVVVEELMIRGRHGLQEVLSVGFKPGRGGYETQKKEDDDDLMSWSGMNSKICVYIQ